jgi:alcohol dehydrogenase (cytochrome c)
MLPSARDSVPWAEAAGEVKMRIAHLIVATLLAAGAIAVSATALLAASPVGRPPPEWSATDAPWPAHNHDLSNTRSTTSTPIDSRTVARLKLRWRFAFTGTSSYGAFASTPIVLGDTVYLQDLNSNVYALARATGRVRWKHLFDSPNVGPNGVSLGWGRLYGATSSTAFALDPATGRLLWSRRLTRSRHEGIEIAPQLYDRKVLFSTVPSNVSGSYRPGALGVVWALSAATGAPLWRFDTVKGGERLWGDPSVNGGGGLWYPPAVDAHGRVFLSVANPAPFPGSKGSPNGASRPGPNLYTDSLVALDGSTGRLLWYRQAVPHDVRDYDLAISAIVTRLRIGGVMTEVVLTAGKMGRVYAFRAADGAPLWSVPVGRHENDAGPLPAKPVDVFPGTLGGVETPMALAGRRLFVPWLDLATRASATTSDGIGRMRDGRGGFTALDAATGKVLWQHRLPSVDFGAATVANDVVFTSTYDGTIYAFDTATGRQLWTARARAGINSFPAVAGRLLLVGAAAAGPFAHPHFELSAYSLP